MANDAGEVGGKPNSGDLPFVCCEESRGFRERNVKCEDHVGLCGGKMGWKTRQVQQEAGCCQLYLEGPAQQHSHPAGK